MVEKVTLRRLVSFNWGIEDRVEMVTLRIFGCFNRGAKDRVGLITLGCLEYLTGVRRQDGDGYIEESRFCLTGVQKTGWGCLH